MHADLVVIGAGAAGLFCAARAAARGQRVILIEHGPKPGRKIIISGGGRCNFTNLGAGPANYLCSNPHFPVSALKRFSPHDFLDIVRSHGLHEEEKGPGQLFCAEGSKAILAMLLKMNERAGVDLQLSTAVEDILPRTDGFALRSSRGAVECQRLVIATGGLSVPACGATGFAYEWAKRFGLELLPTRPGLVPFTLSGKLQEESAALSGVAIDVRLQAPRGPAFREMMLFTHRGLSGPAVLQVSSYTLPGEAVTVDFLPDEAPEPLARWRQAKPRSQIIEHLGSSMPRRVVQDWFAPRLPTGQLAQLSKAQMEQAESLLRRWPLVPAATEGYRTAEVTLGGINTRELSQKDFSARKVNGLHFIGECMDVTGQLGGYNFQWAWASADACAQSL